MLQSNPPDWTETSLMSTDPLPPQQSLALLPSPDTPGLVAWWGPRACDFLVRGCRSQPGRSAHHFSQFTHSAHICVLELGWGGGIRAWFMLLFFLFTSILLIFLFLDFCLIKMTVILYWELRSPTVHTGLLFPGEEVNSWNWIPDAKIIRWVWKYRVKLCLSWT